MHPGIIPLAARSRLAARATDAKICLWQIKHRRVQTAAVGLCRGVYVLIARVGALSFQRIMHRRVQTAAVGLCRGVYVFIGRVGALSFQRIMLRRVQTSTVGLCRGVYVFIGRVQLCPSSGLCSGVCRQPQWVYVGVFMYSLAGWQPVLWHTLSSGLCSGVGRQPQWVYVGVFMYSLTGWQPVLRSELYLIIHAEMPLRLFMDFSAGSLCIFNRNITASQEKLYLILRAALSLT
mgnify:CR=1 FL=1